MLRNSLRLTAWCSVLAVSAGAWADEVDFDRDIRPLLSDTCYHCHGPDEATRQADLRLDTEAGLFGIGHGTGVVSPGDGDSSELLRRVLSDDEFEQMPPPDSNLSLSSDQKDLLRRWIQQGAPWSGHWSFSPPQRPALPAVRQAEWPRNPIDTFVLARLETAGMSPAPEAERHTLLRRVTLDLTGLPPTPEELDAFLADDAPDAYERVVDRLLASTRYGERMAWEWLDAARYADTNGFQGDPDRTMWPWRDWVIRSLNENLPFDQFTIQQLAGDMLPEATQDQRLASGFNRNHMYNGEGGRIAEETRVENVFDRTETTSTVWLGLTMGCARCHDHKFDPISQAEYFQFYDFFNQTSEAGATMRGNIPPLLELRSPENQQELSRAGKRLNAAAQRVKELENDRGETGIDVAEPVQAALQQSPWERNDDALDLLIAFAQETADTDYGAALSELKSAAGRQRRAQSAAVPVMIMDRISEPRETKVLERGAYDKPTEVSVTSDVPEVLPSLTATQRADRLALAQWLVSADNPLTARVTVNRHWQMFFGRGIVKTADDFGSQGERPTHPELLDWLATEFIESGWDVKHLHRLIITSATYRQSSKVTPEKYEQDPTNQRLARGVRQRLPSWMLRDQALAVSGLLVAQVGGAPVKPYQPPGIWAEATFGQIRYQQDSGDALYRRSLYTFWRRIVGPTVFFDTAKRQTCEVNVARTNTPLHALTTLNDVTYVEAARALAERVLLESEATTTARVRHLYRIVLAREPHPDEFEVLARRVDRLTADFQANPVAASDLIAVGESVADSRLDPVELATYASMSLLVLNLDEALSKE